MNTQRIPQSSADLTREAKTRLLNSALSLFSEKGYEGTSIREIIGRANVTRPVLYYYFKNKEDLFRRLVEGLFTEFHTQIDHILVTVAGCRDRLKATTRLAFEYAEKSPEAVRLILWVFFSAPHEGPALDTHWLHEERFSRLVRIMQDGLNVGELLGGDAEALALVFSGLVDVPIMTKCHHPEVTLTPEFANALVDLFFEGAASAGTERLGLVSPFGSARAGARGSSDDMGMGSRV